MSDVEARRRHAGIEANLNSADRDAKRKFVSGRRNEEAKALEDEKNQKFMSLFGESFETVRENVNNSTKEYFVVYSGAERKVEQVDQFGNLKILVGKDKMNISFRGAESGRVEEK